MCVWYFLKLCKTRLSVWTSSFSFSCWVCFCSTQIRISYIDILNSREERQDDLLRRYYFLCDCARCSYPEWPEEQVGPVRCSKYGISHLLSTLSHIFSSLDLVSIVIVKIDYADLVVYLYILKDVTG